MGWRSCDKFSHVTGLACLQSRQSLVSCWWVFAIVLRFAEAGGGGVFAALMLDKKSYFAPCIAWKIRYITCGTIAFP